MNIEDPTIFNPAGPGARKIEGVWWVMFVLAIVVYIVVAGFILYAVARRSDDTEGTRTDTRFIWIGGLAMPVVLLAVVASLTVSSANALNSPEGGTPLRVSVSGRQWWWQVVYPRQAIVTANELRVPVGQPVDIELTTADVIHSFWVPQLNGKLDAVPDHVNRLRIRADRAGVFRGACAEYCGPQHANMNFVVIALPPTEFDRWVARRQAVPGAPADQLAAQGQAVFTRAACAGCHAVKGTSAVGTQGPDLTNVGERLYLGAGAIPNRSAYLERFIVDAPHFKPHVKMPPVELSAAERRAVVAYLESLK